MTRCVRVTTVGIGCPVCLTVQSKRTNSGTPYRFNAGSARLIAGGSSRADSRCARFPTTLGGSRDRQIDCAECHEYHPPSRRRRRRSPKRAPPDAFRRETFALPREAAREGARNVSPLPQGRLHDRDRSWRELPDDRIEFTMRRLPSAD